MPKNYTVDEVSDQLRVSKRTILREIKRGNLEAKKAGRRYLISDEVIKRYTKAEGDKDLDLKIDQFLKSKKGEMVDLLQKMVSMHSESEGNNDNSDIAQIISQKMESLGIRNSVLSQKDALIMRASYGYAEEGLLITCPLNVAPVGNIASWTFPPFGGVIKGGKMYGRGTAYSKAGIVAALYALSALKKFVEEDNLRVELVFDDSQIDKYGGMKVALRRGLYANAGIIGHATKENYLILGCRGCHQYTFKTKGLCANTGSDEKRGVNAVEKMARFISEMKKQQLINSDNEKRDQSLSMNFSYVSGGQKNNIVPDMCESVLDVYTTKDIDKEDVDEVISAVVEKLKNKDKDFSIESERNFGSDAYSVNDTNNIVTSLEQSAEKVFDDKPSKCVSSDSNVGTILSEVGVPSVVFGPNGGNAYSYDEYIEIDSLTQTAQVYALTAMKYFGIE